MGRLGRPTSLAPRGGRGRSEPVVAQGQKDATGANVGGVVGSDAANPGDRVASVGGFFLLSPTPSRTHAFARVFARGCRWG
jgi:hypothetical protein